MAAKLDAPLWMHWRKAALWLTVQGIVLAGAVLAQDRFQGGQALVADCPADPTPNCSKSSASCPACGQEVVVAEVEEVAACRAWQPEAGHWVLGCWQESAPRDVC